MSSYIPCSNPSVCGVKHHRKGTAAAQQCNTASRSKSRGSLGALENVRSNSSTRDYQQVLDEVSDSVEKVGDTELAFYQHPLCDHYDLLESNADMMNYQTSIIFRDKDSGKIYHARGDQYDWDSDATIFTIVEMSEHHDVVPVIATGENGKSIEDPELTASFLEFTQQHKSVFNYSESDIVTFPYSSPCIEGSKVFYNITPSQEQDFVGNNDLLGLDITLSDNGEKQNARVYETASVFYDKNLKRGFILSGTSSSEYGSSPGLVKFTKEGLQIPNIENKSFYSYDRYEDSFIPITGTDDTKEITWYEKNNWIPLTG